VRREKGRGVRGSWPWRVLYNHNTYFKNRYLENTDIKSRWQQLVLMPNHSFYTGFAIRPAKSVEDSIEAVVKMPRLDLSGDVFPFQAP
jgi:hypothetical protein